MSDDEAPPAPKKRPQPPPAMPAKAKVKGKKGADEAEAEVEEIKRPPFELFEQEAGSVAAHRDVVSCCADSVAIVLEHL